MSDLPYRKRAEFYTPRICRKPQNVHNVFVFCQTCGNEIMLNSLTVSNSPRILKDRKFCSPTCKLLNIFKDKHPKECWLYTTPCFLLGRRSYSIKCLTFFIYHKESLAAPNIILLCDSKLCANPDHMEAKQPLKPRLRGVPEYEEDDDSSCL